MKPSFGIENTANTSVIAFLKAGIRSSQLSEEGAKSLYDPPTLADPDITLAQTHPDTVERIWQLGAAMPQDCRAIVYGAPALVHPQTGVIIAFGAGTVYFLRLPSKLATEAIKAGALTHHKWSFGGGMDIHQELGKDWVGGCWLQKEPVWCLQAYKQVGQTLL